MIKGSAGSRMSLVVEALTALGQNVPAVDTKAAAAASGN